METRNTSDKLNVSSVSAENSAVSMKEKKIGADKKRTNTLEDPRNIVRQGLIIIILFFGILGIWATFSKITGAVVATGKVKIDTERKTVQHLEGGIVESILVREGDEVESGQVLIILESIQVEASVDMLRKQLIASKAAYARYYAEKERLNSIDLPNDLREMAQKYAAQDALHNEQKIFSARRDALNSQLSLLESQINQIGLQISGLDEQYKAEQKIIATLVEELNAKRQLFKERYLEKSQILELERTLASHQGNKGHIKQSIAESRQKSEELRLRIEDAINRFVEDATRQLGNVDNEIQQLQEKIRPLTDIKQRLNVVAPVSGRIVGLKVHSKGGVVRSGDPLLDIVPKDTPLLVEAQIPVNKITDIYIGQDANIQLDAFDIQLTPMIAGKVAHVSADRLEDDKITGSVPYYMCFIEASNESLKKENAYLTPGMPATVFITTKEKTVLYYILEPLIKSWNKSMRE